MLGVIVNTIAVVLAGIVGLLLKEKVSDKLTKAAMTAVGFCTLYIGISGTLEGNNSMVLIISMVFGTLIGTLLDIDGRINYIGECVSKKFNGNKDSNVSISEGFVTASLLFCVGSMAIIGSFNAGLSGDCRMLFTKSALDFISSFMLSASLGMGVIFSGVSVFAYQGILVLLAHFISPILSEAVIAEINCTGSLIIVALSFNLIGISKFKVANFLPAIFLVPFAYMLLNLFGAI